MYVRVRARCVRTYVRVRLPSRDARQRKIAHAQLFRACSRLYTDGSEAIYIRVEGGRAQAIIVRSCKIGQYGS